MIKKLKHITETCREIYEEQGFQAVCDYMNDYMERSITGDVNYEYCQACDNDVPAWRSNCLICGQPTAASKQTLVDVLIEQIKSDGIIGDYTVLDELLNMLDAEKLVQALPEEQWKNYKHLRDE